jgi:hypothetical protein
MDLENLPVFARLWAHPRLVEAHPGVSKANCDVIEAIEIQAVIAHHRDLEARPGFVLELQRINIFFLFA